jgi:hypothetical protein
VALEVPPPVPAVGPPTGLAAVAEEWEYEADSASPPQVPRFPTAGDFFFSPPLSLHLPVMEFDALTKYSKLVTNFCSASFSKLAARAEDFSVYLVWDFVYTHSSATTLYDVEAAAAAATLLPQRLCARVLSESPRQRLQQVVESEEVVPPCPKWKAAASTAAPAGDWNTQCSSCLILRILPAAAYFYLLAPLYVQP